MKGSLTKRTVKGGSMKGSLTIELSFVMTVILIALMTMFSIGLLLHDMSCVSSILNEAALNGLVWLREELKNSQGIYIKDAQEELYQGLIEEYIYMELERKVILLKAEAIELQIMINRHLLSNQITIKADWKNQAYFLNSFFDKKSMTVTRRDFAGCELVRVVELADDVSEEIIILKPLKDKYWEMVDSIESLMNNW